jgi:hypothetical protein
MVGAWHDLLRAHAAAAARTIGALASTTEPLAVVRGFVAGLHDRWRRALLRHLGDFNALDPNVLPVAHAAGHDHPTYNKYGIAQRRLLELTPRFPAGLGALRWGEAELLVKVLAELDIDRLG